MTDRQERALSLRNDIAAGVRALLPGDEWSEVTVRFGEFNDVMYASGSIVDGEHRRPLRIIDTESQAAWVSLKKIEATDRGAWLSSVLVLSKDGVATFSNNFDRRPNFASTDYDRFFDIDGPTARPDDAALVQELRRFPRVESAIPDWWRALLVASANSNAARENERDEILASGRLPFTEDPDRVARAAYYLHTRPEVARANHRELPDLRAVLVWVPTRGGGKVVLDDDGEALFGNSTLTSDALIEMFRSGRRTAPELFDEPRAAPIAAAPDSVSAFLSEFPAAARAIAAAIRVEPSSIANHARLIPELGAVYAWQGFLGGDQCVAGSDGSVLFGFSSLTPAVLLGGYATGRRTPANSLTGPRSGNPGSCAEVWWRRMRGDTTATAIDAPRTVDQMASLLDVSFVDTSIAAIPGLLMALGRPGVAVIAIERADGPGTWVNAVFDGESVQGVDATLGQTFDWPADFGLVTSVKAAIGAIQ